MNIITQLSKRSSEILSFVSNISNRNVIIDPGLVEPQLLGRWKSERYTQWFVAIQDDYEIGFVLDECERLKTKVILEIGLGFAGTHMLLKQVSPEVISVDKNPGYVGLAVVLLKQMNMLDGSLFILGTSYKVVSLLDTFLDGRKIDTLFIDGSHAEDVVIHDLYNYIEYVRKGGHIWFHDYFNKQGVHDAVEKLAQQFDIDIFRHEKGPGLARMIKS